MAVRTVLFAIALHLPSAATAQVFTIDPTLFEADPTAWNSEGVGAPSVVYAHDKGHFVMLFETMTGTSDAQCPDGYWSIGYAWSQDGLNWSVGDGPILEPTAGSYTGCGMRQPSVLRNGETQVVLFASLQEADTCASGVIPSWGCTRDSGIGYAMFSEDWSRGQAGARLRMNSMAQILTPVVEGPGYAEPSLISYNGNLHMYVDWLGEIKHATSLDLATWTFDATPVLTPGAHAWSQDSLYSPSAACVPSTTGATMSASGPVIDLVYGGRTWGLSGLTEAGWTNALSPDSSAFLTNAAGAAFTYSTLDEFISMDALRDGATTLIWFEELAADGRPAIGFATDGTWMRATIEDRRCDN